MNTGFVRWLAWALLGSALALVCLPPAQARMGGGHSYSGGSSSSSSSSSRSSSSSSSSHSSGSSGFHWGGTSSSSGSSSFSSSGGGGGSDSGQGFTLLVEIIILFLVVYILFRLLAGPQLTGKTASFQSGSARDRTAANAGLDSQIAALQARDGNFSKVLFLDFASLLYHKFHSFKGTGQFKQLTPYLSQALIEQIQGNAFQAGQSIHAIVIGMARPVSIVLRDRRDVIVVEFEANLSLRYPGGEEARFANREQWTFTRQAGVLSAEPAQMRNLSCPSCGAPADFTDAGECQYCHSFIQAGEKQWQVADMRLLGREPFKLENPAAYVEEAGTELPTLKQADLAGRGQALLARHGLVDWGGFFEDFKKQVVKPCFMATYSAWSQGRWPLARHLVSDRLYAANQFWMEEYARQGWQNRLEQIQIHDVALARIDLDKFYESLTVRIFASCLDYTVDRQGKIIGGSNKKPRRFSEYWTFIRSTEETAAQTVYDVQTCPACGAPADKVGQAGECGYCGSKLSEGRFSWVLAIITQDEAYTG